MLVFLDKVREFILYVVMIYMVTMTGLYFHMDSRIAVLQSIQTNSLELFKSYSQKDMKQQGDIDQLAGQIDELKDQIDNLDNNMDSKLDRLSALIIQGME